jgi:hypothetical protein
MSVNSRQLNNTYFTSYTRRQGNVEIRSNFRQLTLLLYIVEMN